MIGTVCKEIIKELGIYVFVETGTDMGETIAEAAKWFSGMDPKFGKISDYVTTGARGYSLESKPIRYPVFEDVGDSKFKIFSVDIDSYSFKNAKKLFKTNLNISLFCANSSEFLKDFIDRNIFKSSQTIFFLDAHWGKYWPLRDEIKQILKLEKFVIVIDDFFVPGLSNSAKPHGNFGFDFYHSRILCWGYIDYLFNNIDVKVYYPKQPNKDHRGFVLLFKGYNSEELGFLKGLLLEHIDKDDPAHSRPVPLSPR